MRDLRCVRVLRETMTAAFAGRSNMLKYLSLSTAGLVLVASPAAAEVVSPTHPFLNCSMNARMDSYRDYWLRRKLHGDPGRGANIRTPAPPADRYRNDLDTSTGKRAMIIDSSRSLQIISHN